MKKIYLLCLMLMAFGMISLAQNASSQRFVYAPSGLNLRVSADANSEKIKTVGMGEPVELLKAPDQENLVVDGLKGGMAKVSAGGQEGYMFSGYLVPVPPNPESEPMGFEQYRDLIREMGYSVLSEKTERDYEGYYQTELTLDFLEWGWQEVFLFGKVNYRIPAGLNFPSMQGKGEKTIPNPKTHPSGWTDEMTVTYNSGGALEKISYTYRGEGGGYHVQVSKKEDRIRLNVLYIGD